MQNQVLQPPNSHALSEDVIGNVVQRKWLQSRSFDSKVDGRDLGQQGRRVNASESSSTRGMNPSMSSSKKRFGTTHVLTMAGIVAVADQPTLDELSGIMEAKRKDRRIIQLRYRSKRKRAEADLEDYVQQLRGQVEHLQYKRNRLLSDVATKDALWSVAIEYFCIFRHGMPESHASALDFLHTTMAPDLDTGAISGIEELIRKWRVFTQLFPDVHTQLESLRRVANNSLIARTCSSITLTRQSLQDAFPSLRNDGGAQNKRRENIVARLLGQRVVMHGSVRFDWDSVSNRVVRLYSIADILSPLSPLLHLLGNLEDVSIVFRDACVHVGDT